MGYVGVERKSNFQGKHIYLMVGKPNVTGEEHSQPVAAWRRIHAFGQLLQNWKVTSLEVVSQGDVKLFFMRFNLNIWTKESKR